MRALEFFLNCNTENGDEIDFVCKLLLIFTELKCEQLIRFVVLVQRSSIEMVRVYEFRTDNKIDYNY